MNTLGEGRVNTTTLNDKSDTNKNNNLDDDGINTNALISLTFIRLPATTPTNYNYPNGNIDNNTNKEALEPISFQSRDHFN